MLTKFKMLLISFLLLGCINFATPTKSKIFTIMSTTKLQRNLESIWTFNLESTSDEIALKNILISSLQKFNDTEAYEGRTHEMEPSRSVELSDIYISFGNISAMLTKVNYVDFSQLTHSTVDIIMKVEESPVQRNIQINSTITTEKMTLHGQVTLLGSDYGFTIEMAKPTFQLNKLISEEALRTTTNQSETFNFDYITTNFHPVKDFKTFLIGRSGLTTSILQRMADSWLPPIIELLKEESLSHKIQHYEMKLVRNDDKKSFSRRLCCWLKTQSTFSANDIPINEDGITSMNISANNIGSYKSCDGDFFSVKGTNNILISLVVRYPLETYLHTNVSLSRTEILTTTTEQNDYESLDRRMQTLLHVPVFRNYISTCNPVKIHTIEMTIEFEIKDGTNEITTINNKGININKQNPLLILCPGMDGWDNRRILYSALQNKLIEYLTEMLVWY